MLLVLKGKMGIIRRFLVSLLLLFVGVWAMFKIVVPCMKDYPMAAAGEYIEVEVTVVDFTEVGNGPGEFSPSVWFAKPKGYIESTGEYIIIPGNDNRWEIGKTYRIRYLPNSMAKEILYVVEK